MAIVQNFWLKGAKKRLAGAVIYKAGGQTIQRALAESVSNPRTRAQMTQRVKWANIVNFYRPNRSWMRYAYETKKANQSEYNKLMSLNVSNSNIYLTKQAAANGACVVAGYTMTQGSLPSITYNFGQDGYIHTNIFLDPDSSLDVYCTIAEFSAVVIAKNPALQEGDQLSFLRYTQMVDSVTGFPYVIVRKYEVILSLSNPDKLANYWPTDLTNLGEENMNELVIYPTGNAGGLLLVLSRTISGKTFVSTQSILPVDNSAIISAWSSQQALDRAIQSYGESDDAFLSSDTADMAGDYPIQLVPLSVTIGSTTIAANEYAGKLSSWVGKQLVISFNENVVGSISNIWLDTYEQGNNGTAGQSLGAVSGNSVIVNSVTAGSVDPTNQVRAIRVILDSSTYEISFPYDQADGGLE